MVYINVLFIIQGNIDINPINKLSIAKGTAATSSDAASFNSLKSDSKLTSQQSSSKVSASSANSIQAYGEGGGGGGQTNIKVPSVTLDSSTISVAYDEAQQTAQTTSFNPNYLTITQDPYPPLNNSPDFFENNDHMSSIIDCIDMDDFDLNFEHQASDESKRDTKIE